MAGWPEFVETWLERAAGDRRLRAIGSGTDVAFTLRSGDDVVWIHLREGVRSRTRSTTASTAASTSG